MPIIKLDGISMRLESPDLDNDGATGGIELIKQKIDTSIIPIQQSNELADIVKEINRDEIEPNTKMSAIDTKSRLANLEVSSITAWDTLVWLKFLPNNCLFFTRQKKRLSVSLDGKGRSEIVDLVSGKKELESKGFGSFRDRVKNLVGMRKKDKNE